MPRATTKAPSLADGPTLASTRDYWTLHLRSEGKSERTISTYLRALDRLDAFLAERGMPRTLEGIRREHLEAFFVGLGEIGNAPATISILFRALRPFWRWLVEEDEIERSPMERMRAPSVPLDHPPVLSDDQAALLLAACRGTDLIARRDLAMLSLLLDTGIRRGELAALRLGDLNLGEHLAFIEAFDVEEPPRPGGRLRGRHGQGADALPPPSEGTPDRRRAAVGRADWSAAHRQRDLPHDRPSGAPGRAARPSPPAPPHLGVAHARGRPQRGRRHAIGRLDPRLDAVALRRGRGC